MWIILGCGAIMEELPYLEIPCVPDAQANALCPEARADWEEDGCERHETKSLESLEKQGSLIPLAWSKPPEDDADYRAEDEDGEADILSNTGIQIQPSQCKETVQETDSKEVDT